MVWHPWSCWMQASKKPWAACSHEYCTQHPVTVRDGLNLCEVHFHYHIARAYGEKRLCNCEACIHGRHVEHVPLPCTQLPCSPRAAVDFGERRPVASGSVQCEGGVMRSSLRMQVLPCISIIQHLCLTRYVLKLRLQNHRLTCS